jgi:N-methylhydantoinase B
MAASIFPHVANCVFKAFIEVIPERCMAGPTGLSNIVWGGSDERNGVEGEYVCYLWLEGGWGGRPAMKDNSTAMTIFATGARNQPVELHERTAPFMFDCYRLEPDSGGPGRSRGALGVTRRWQITHGEATLSCLGDGGRAGPWGFAGGGDASPNRFVYAEGTDDEVDIGMVATGLEIRAGRMLEYRQSGGGGYGDPFTRDPAWVLADVIEGYVTVEGARRDYGVAIETGEAGYVLNESKTRRLRSATVA